jgi:uncharacterized protein
MPLFGPSMPRPLLDDPDTEPFWDACREHRLVVQQCTRCEEYRSGPAPLCFNCLSDEQRWVESEGVGEIYTWTVCHRSFHRASDDAAPYTVVVVRLADCGGALITSNLVRSSNDAPVYAGMKVALVWDDLSQDCSLPLFAPTATKVVEPDIGTSNH